MKFTIDKQSLLSILSRTVPIADRKSAMPILGCVLLDAGGGTLAVSATDLFTSVSVSGNAVIHDAGKWALPAKDLHDRVKVMPDGPLVISVDDNLVTLRGVGSNREFKMRAMSGSDYPLLPQSSGGKLSIKAETITELLEMTAFSASPDESRPQLNCALFEAEGDVVRMVTTDGHRLTVYETEHDGSEFKMLLPQKTFISLRQLTGDVLVSESPANVFFETESIKLSFKEADASFPPWQQVMPKAPNLVVVDRATLVDTLRAMIVSANDRTTSVHMRVTNGTMQLTSESMNGNARDEIGVEYSGSELIVGFSARYMLDALCVLNEPQVRIGLDGSLDPIKITPVSAREFTAVIMPVRLS